MTMKKIIAVAVCAVTMFGAQLKAQERATLSACVYGYKGEKVYFDCVQSPLIAEEFYTNPGEEHLFTFPADDLVCMLINGKTKVLLQKGDSIHAEVRYDGRAVSVQYSGSDEAVKSNNLLKRIDEIKRTMRYRSQLLGCAALDIKPKTRIDDSRILLQKVSAAISEAQVSEDVANYIMAGIESEAYVSFMEYPVMYASVRATAIEQQEIGDYWSIMDGYTLRTDAVSLSNPEYAGLLMRYCFYMNEKKAKQGSAEYQMPTTLETMYAELAAFYEGAHRDVVLYTLLCNFIKNGKEIERADALYADYKQKYNINKDYITILDAILQ
ncbi:MAG: hypothetical protein IJF46_00855 [Bacteroidaceae bacterium]|nr:hypothetical protein [Bacteroidaceae bacterium]